MLADIPRGLYFFLSAAAALAVSALIFPLVKLLRGGATAPLEKPTPTDADAQSQPALKSTVAPEVAGPRTEADVMRDLRTVTASFSALGAEIRLASQEHSLGNPLAGVRIQRAQERFQAIKAQISDLEKEAAQLQKAQPKLEPPTPPAQISAEAIGLELHTSRSTGRAYWRNAIPAPLADYPQLKGDAFFRYRLSGASYHQSELEAAAGGRRDGAVYFRVNVVVAAEPSNAFDPNAVAIYLGGALVAYVPRVDAEAFGSELRVLVGGPYGAQARAEISGAYEASGDPSPWTISLDVLRPLELNGTKT